MNRLNGWQRIFVVISVIWMLPVYFFGPELHEVYPFNYVKPILLENSKTERQGRVPDWARERGETITMFDGVVLPNTGFSKEVYETAYRKSLPAINAAKRKAVQDYLIDITKIYFLPLLALYFLGWSVGWIRRGFIKHKTEGCEQ
jgi:hypothetical protein